MSTASTRLEKPIYLWLARILGFGLVFAYIWIHIQSIRDQIPSDNGVVWDIGYDRDENGNYICCITYISIEAAQKGVAIGDKLLNPAEADELGPIGTEVHLQFQTGDEPPREVTFTREPINFDVYGAKVLLDLPAKTSISLALFLAVFPVFLLVLAALFLCWFRSDDWMTLLTAAVLIGLYDLGSSEQWANIVISIVNILLWVWLILFPNGKLTPKWAWMPILLKIPREIVDTPITQGMNICAMVMILIIIAYRYKNVFSPMERQQSKWIIFPFILGILPVVTSDRFYYHYWQSEQYELAVATYFINTASSALLVSAMIFGILFSIFKYRLYDVDVFISRTLVYSSLTGILGLLWAMTIPIIEHLLSQLIGDQSSLMTVLVSALPVAALFNPLRERLQRFVDRQFKPEDVDLENTFIEFTPELSSYFTKKELSILLSDQAVEQLGVSYASVFLNGKNGDLKHVKTTSVERGVQEPVLNQKTMETIKRGELAVPDGDSAHALVIPLVVPRSQKPSLLGALVLGPRVKGLGYPTDMQRNLKKLGEEVGKALYVAEVKNRTTEES